MTGPEDDERRRTANLAGAAVLLALAVAAVWLLRLLDERRKLEDCLEAAGRDCLSRFAPQPP